jgi:cellulose synthase/poly-beta-1,6-N-acetylglucosamine synthase-like glycosyltransferase
MLLWFVFGNFLSSKNKESILKPGVSVIVAIRNGGESLSHLISTLSKQDYLGEMEFILVDDDSDDSTKEIILQKSNLDNRFILENSNTGDASLNHKKRALDAGIKRAKNEWLLFTDVDCKFSSSWVSEMAKNFTNKNKYIIGFSEVCRDKNWVTIFQSLDYLMLMIAARGSANLGVPWASSGQNQAYRKSLYNSIGGFSKISNYLQGDDSLFLQLCRNSKTGKIVFVDDFKLRTKARQERKIKSLFKQRLRWAGDAKIMWKFNKIFFLSMLITYSHAVLLLIMVVLGIINNSYVYNTLFYFLIIHIFIEFILYITATLFFNKRIRPIDFIFWSIFHIFFIVIVGSGILLYNRISWKGRLNY